MNQVIRDTVATFEGSCEQRQISIALTLTGNVMHVVGDKSKIQQVLYNLLDNAIKFPTITLRSRSKQEKRK